MAVVKELRLGSFTFVSTREGAAIYNEDPAMGSSLDFYELTPEDAHDLLEFATLAATDSHACDYMAPEEGPFERAMREVFGEDDCE